MWCYHCVPTQPHNLKPKHSPTTVCIKYPPTTVLFPHTPMAQAFPLCHAAMEHPMAQLQLCPSATMNSSLLKLFVNARAN